MELVLVLMAATVVAGAVNDCVVDNFKVQANFDIKKWMGKWYEISWVPFYFEASSANYRDFVQEYTLASTDAADNTSKITAVSAGRVKKDDDDCVSGSKSFETSDDDPAKWTSTKTVNGTVYNLDHWVIATDYTNYAFVYGCTKPMADNSSLCEQAHAWKFSRTKELSADHLSKVNAAVTATCMTGYTFVASEQTKECEIETSGVAMPGTGSALLLCAILWQLIA